MLQVPLLRSWQINRQFWLERALLNGRSPAVTDHISVIHFSINKAATQYTKRIMLRCGVENELLAVRMNDYAWNKDFPFLFTLSEEELERYVHIFHPCGYLYTVFGGLVEGIPNIQDYRTVVMIRDPRDILVSEYYSYSKSHSSPRSAAKLAEFETFRAKVKDQTVDEYTIEASHRLKFRLQQYLNLQQAAPAICVLKYEEMIADFSTWLNKLLAHCQWQISATLHEQLLEEAGRGRRKKHEDPNSHRRQITPGDHKRKLQPETINYLNEYMAEVLLGFDYQI